MSLINIEYNNKEITEIILENIMKMFEKRKIITSWKEQFDKFTDLSNNNVFNFDINYNKYSIYLLIPKMSSIIQNSPLDDYLSNNITTHKIIIGFDVSKKIVKQILFDYKNTEFFFNYEMLEDIPSKVFIPQHILLYGDELKELTNKFNDNDLGKIYLTDFMSRYFNAQIGNIFKIIRPSIISGNNIFYRKVINGSVDILFPT